MSRVTSGSARTAPGRCLFAFGILTSFTVYAAAPAAAQLVLDSGQTHVITPAQTECLEITASSHDGLPVSAECDNSTGTADVNAMGFQPSGAPVGSIDVLASSVFQLVFRVEDGGGSAPPSRIPIHVRIPAASYALRLENNAILELGGNASMDIFLQLRQDPDLASGSRGTVVERSTIVGATHGGISGCLSIPTDPASAVELGISCTLESHQSIRGNAQVSLGYVVEVGRLYNLELQIIAHATRGAISAARVGASTDVIFPSAPGLAWNQMVVTVGTDPAALVAGLEEQIAELQDQIDDLRTDLESHTHTYLTGRGVGHNNTVAVSSPAVIPDDTSGDVATAPPPPGARNPPGAGKIPKGRNQRLPNFGK